MRPEDGVAVGSRHGITGDDAVESHISFPINASLMKILRVLFYFFSLFPKFFFWKKDVGWRREMRGERSGLTDRFLRGRTACRTRGGI